MSTWWVVCADHEVGPCKTAEVAQRRLDEVVSLGACRLPHRVEERAKS